MPVRTSQAVNSDGARSVPSLDIIRSILNRGSEDAMPGQRYQDPKILIRSDVSRPFYYIQPYVPVLTAAGMVRKRQNIQLGFCDEMTMRKAKARKEQIMATVNAGRFIIQSQIPFGDLVQRFLDLHVPTLGPATQDDYRNKIKKHILPTFENCRLCDITTDAVQLWLNEKAASGLAWWSRRGLRNIMSSIFTQAEKWRLWDGRNPCERVNVGRQSEKWVKRIPKSEDLKKFLDALADTAICTAEGARYIVLTAVASGLRISEILGLQPGDIDSQKQTIKVARGWRRGSVVEPKSAASRRVRKISGLAEELLRFAAGKSDDAFIFGRADRDGEPPDDRDLQQHVFRPAAESVGIYRPGFGMHTFRRLNITWRQEAGATPFEAQKAAGHAQPSTTWMYTITDDEREQAHVEAILDRVGHVSKVDLATMKAVGGIN
jgi:integrase